MTFAELDRFLAGRPVARAGGRCFVTLYDADELAAFAAAGAICRPLKEPGRPGAEVHIASMLDPMTEVAADGVEVDVRESACLAYFRERDGYGWGSPTTWEVARV